MTQFRRAGVLLVGCTVVALTTLHATPRSQAAAKGGASPDPVASVISLVVHRESSISSYRAHARLDVRQLNFPYLHPVLNGTENYSRPGFTVFDFPHVPSYLKGITKVEGAVYAANRWQRCYDISLTKLPDAYVLHMTPKIRGEVSDIDVTVGRAGQIHHMDWYYHNQGDHISLDQYYGIVLGYSVVTLQQSQITLRHIRAQANGTFDGFEFDVPVPTPTPTPSDPLHQCDN
ncbi:MAG: hypothetical protein GIW99_10805 [Candidatus Eremiobacteraeota bacterium]|nr:hypothetical protein [Candidatus Eremiobacteraeota bacterium]MBC5828152.1 hypothetical protein [Candidatus Eremiobacteraeota bacterium]